MQLEECKQRILELETSLHEQQLLANSLNNIVELSVVGVLILDEKQKIVFANNTACIMLGLNKDELHDELFGFPVMSGKCLEVSYIRQDKKVGRAEMHITESSYLRQHVQIISLHDITERKKLEHHKIQLDLYEKQNCSIDVFLEIVVEKLAEIAQSTIAFLCIFNDSEKLSHARHVYSKSIVDVVGKDVINQCPITDIEEIWNDVIESREPVIVNDFDKKSCLEKNIITAKLKITQLIKVPIIENNKIVALVSVANKSTPYDESDVQSICLLAKNALKVVQQKELVEITKNLKVRLSQAQRMDTLGQLTGGIAHDFNNLLGVISGYSDLLEIALNDQPKNKKYVEEIHKSEKRAENLTKKLLSFSRKTESKAGELDLNNLLNQQKDMLQKTLTARVNLIYKLSTKLWTVWLDSNDMEDIILNVSINSMHAIVASGDLIFETRNEVLSKNDADKLSAIEGDYVLLSITDTGCGMDEVTKERIFEPFFSTKKDKGTGLGLSQVYDFVQRSKSFVKVYSELNKGTQFVFYIPRYTEDVSQADTLKITGEVDTKGTEKVLVVDDESSLLSLSKEILSRQGYIVFCAKNASEALKIIESESIDLLFSDVIMPGMNGYELASIVKGKYPSIKVLLTSGFSEDRATQATGKMFKKSILQKPYSNKSLLNEVRLSLDDRN